MQLRHAALGVILGLLIVAGVQLYGDSTPGETEPPEVDFSEPPKEIAKDALRILRRTDHTVETIKLRENDPYTFSITKYEASDYEVATNYTGLSAPSGINYRNREMGWYRDSTGDLNRYRPGAIKPFAERQPYDPERLDSANVTVVQNNESTLVLEIRDIEERASFSPLAAGNGRYFIDKRTGRIETVIFDQDFVARDDWVPSKFEISDYGETDVEPLSNVPTYDHETILKDLLHGPIFSV